jgi:hypothetical protein
MAAEAGAREPPMSKPVQIASLLTMDRNLD